ncbi:MAG: hypothetical protein ACHQ6U_10230 [Thermodesulfobacteriota bacterium]
MVINRDSLGVTEENNFLQLYYDRHSNTLIADFYRAIGQGYGLISLWTRRASVKIYSRLSKSGERLSSEDPVLSPSSPHLYTNVLQVHKKNCEYDGYEWRSVERIDLNTEHSESITVSEGIGIESSLEKTRISSLHGASADGSELYCSVAFQKRGGDKVYPTEYYLSRFIIGEGRFEKITRLTANFL